MGRLNKHHKKHTIPLFLSKSILRRQRHQQHFSDASALIMVALKITKPEQMGAGIVPNTSTVTELNRPQAGNWDL